MNQKQDQEYSNHDPSAPPGKTPKGGPLLGNRKSFRATYQHPYNPYTLMSGRSGFVFQSRGSERERNRERESYKNPGYIHQFGARSWFEERRFQQGYHRMNDRNTFKRRQPNNSHNTGPTKFPKWDVRGDYGISSRDEHRQFKVGLFDPLHRPCETEKIHRNVAANIERNQIDRINCSDNMPREHKDGKNNEKPADNLSVKSTNVVGKRILVTLKNVEVNDKMIPNSDDACDSSGFESGDKNSASNSPNAEQVPCESSLKNNAPLIENEQESLWEALEESLCRKNDDKIKAGSDEPTERLNEDGSESISTEQPPQVYQSFSDGNNPNGEQVASDSDESSSSSSDDESDEEVGEDVDRETDIELSSDEEPDVIFVQQVRNGMNVVYNAQFGQLVSNRDEGVDVSSADVNEPSTLSQSRDLITETIIGYSDQRRTVVRDNTIDVSLTNVNSTASSAPSQNNESNQTPMEVDSDLENSGNEANKSYKIMYDPVYEVKLLLYKLFELKEQGYEVNLMRCEDGFENLNEAIFCAEKKDPTGKIECLLFMVRCADPDLNNVRAIYLNTLRSKDFKLKKIYNLYFNCREKLKNENKKLKNFTIFTNMNLNQESFKRNKIEIKQDFVNNTDPSNENIEFSLIVPETVNIFQKLLTKEASCLSRIVDKLWIHYEKKTDVRFDGVIAQYHLALINEKVLATTGGKSDKKKTARFRPEFICNINLSSSAKILRSHCIRYFKNIPLGRIQFTVSPKFGVKEYHKEAPLSLPVEPNEHEDIHEFYQSLRIFSEKNDIDISLAKKYGYEFNLINNKNINNIQINLSNALNENPYNISSTCKNMVSKTIVMENMCVPQNIGLCFDKDNTLSELTKVINMKKVILIETNSIELTKQKVKQFVDNHSDFSIEKCIFTKFDTVAYSTEMQEHVFNAFSAPSTELLVIESDTEFQNKKKPIFQNTLIDIMFFYEKKNVIIIGNYEGFTIGFQEQYCTKIEDAPCNIHYFSESTQMNLFNSLKVILHGRHLKFEDVMNVHSFIELTETSDVLLDIFKSSNSVTIGEELAISHDYVPRFLHRKIVISLSVFKNDQAKATFFIEGIRRSTFLDLTGFKNYDKVVYFEKIENLKSCSKIVLINSTDNVDQIAQNKKIQNYHVLKYESKKFIWKKSSGSITSLLKYKSEAPISESDEKIEIPSEKLTVICGRSGFGKSSYLLGIAKNLQQSCDPPIWTAQIRLSNKMANKVKEIVQNNPNDDLIISFLELLHYQPPLIKKLFIMCFKGRLKLKLALFFDCLEDLCVENFELALNLINLLKNSSADNKTRIFVTVSPNLNNKLESKLGVFSYSLGSLSLDEKIKILTSNWVKIPDSKYLDKYDLQKYAECVLKSYSSNKVNLTSHPMYLKMLARIFNTRIHESLIKFMPPESFIVNSIDDYYQLYGMYESYVTFVSVNERMVLQKLCLEKISKPEHYITLYQNLKKYNLLIESDHIIEAAVTVPDDLNHITFAEYFVAQFLFKILDSLPINIQKANDQQISLINDYSQVIEDVVVRASEIFLNCMVYLLKSNGKTRYQEYLSFFVHYGFANTVEALLNYLKEEVDQKLDKFLLYKACGSGNLKVVQFLIKRHNSSHKETFLRHGELIKFSHKETNLIEFISKDSNEESPLEVAASNGHKEVALELLLMGANIKELKHDFLENLSNYLASVISNQDPAKYHKYHPICELLFRLAPSAVANKNFKYPNLLNYFFTHGRKAIIEILLREQKQNSQDFFQPIDGKNPLYYLNFCKFLKDEERLDMVKFLIRKLKIDFRNDQDHNLRSILKAASDYGHSITFNYFINEYEDGRIGFLKYLISESDLNGLKFLYKNNSKLLVDKNGNTPLHTALCMNAKLETIKFLVSKEGINTPNGKKENPLCSGLKERVDFFTIKHLLKEGANVNAEDENGIYAWCYAIIDQDKNYTKAQQLELMNYLFNKANGEAKKLPAEGKNFGYDRVKSEVELKMKYFDNVEDFDLNYDGNVPRLHQAIIQNDDLNTVWAKFLITFGADVDLKDCKGQTALQLALENKNYSVAECLLKHDARFNTAVDKNYVRAFVKNHDSNNPEYQEILKLLTNQSKIIINI